MSIGNILSLLGLLIAVFGCAWGVYKALAVKIDEIEKSNSEKIRRLYERLDENKAQYYTDFVLDKVYKEAHKNVAEMTDQKFINIIKLFETHLNYVSSEIKALREQLNGKSNKSDAS